MSIKSLCDPAGDLSIYTKSVKTERATVSGQFSVTDILAQNVVASNSVTSLSSVTADVMKSTKGYVTYDEKVYIDEGVVSNDVLVVTNPTDIYYTVKLNRMNSGTPQVPVYKTCINIEGSFRATTSDTSAIINQFNLTMPSVTSGAVIKSITGSAIDLSTGIYQILSPTQTTKPSPVAPEVRLTYLQPANFPVFNYYTFNILLVQVA